MSAFKITNFVPVTNLVQHKVHCFIEDERDSSSVIRYVAIYSKGDTCKQKILAFLLRIVDAVKHIFGNSDWQKARDILEQRVYRELPKEAHVALSDEVRDFIDKIMKEYIDLNESGKEMTKENLLFSAAGGRSFLTKLENEFKELMKRSPDLDRHIPQTPVKPQQNIALLLTPKKPDRLLTKKELDDKETEKIKEEEFDQKLERLHLTPSVVKKETPPKQKTPVQHYWVVTPKKDEIIPISKEIDEGKTIEEIFNKGMKRFYVSPVHEVPIDDYYIGEKKTQDLNFPNLESDE